MNKGEILVLVIFAFGALLAIGFVWILIDETKDVREEEQKKYNAMDQCLIEYKDALKCCLQSEYRIKATCYKDYD